MILTKTRLAIDGGKPAVEGPLARFDTIGNKEALFASHALTKPLSGYLGGERHGGYWVERLEKEWTEVFGVKHAIACNSATSGLLLACMAVHVGPEIPVVVSPYTMSATAAAPAFLGARIVFVDIEDQTFCLDACSAGVIITTNLFGHPSNTGKLRTYTLIEDNAQAIFAKEGDKYAGTIGHVGVFSLNVHKHLQCGEGGICVTNDDVLADWMRLGRNHGCMASASVGLNLRMTEVTAAIACAQLTKREQIMNERIEMAETIIATACFCPPLQPPVIRLGCSHSYYMIAWKANNDKFSLTKTGHRRKIVEALKAEGVPVKEGYLKPLYHLPAFQKFKSDCPVAERMENEELITYENCAWTPTLQQLKQFRIAFEKVADAYAGA